MSKECCNTQEPVKQAVEAGCCGSASVEQGLATATLSSGTQGGRTFAVSGLDCVEEVRILERAVGPLVGGSAHLAFDVLNGRMSVLESAEDITDKAICDAVKATGMRASSADDTNAGGHKPSKRNLFTLLSGVAVLLGLLLHTLLAGAPLSWNAIVNAHEGKAMPIPEVVAWLSATLLGIYYVLPKAWYSLKTFRPDMNLLMVIAVMGAIAIGELFEAATVAFLFALSLTLESWSVSRARNAVAALLELTPATVRLITESGAECDEAPANVAPGARFIVRAGDRIALDGVVVEGMGAVDQAPITGESVPVAKVPGDDVFAGTINGEGTLTIRATRAAQDTVLARITRSIGDAHAKRADAERWVDAFARRYTPAVMLLSLLVLLVPTLVFGAPWQTWIYNALVLLVIACPCALVISTPVSIVAALASAARSGVLIKGGTYVELPARLEAVAMDKTGTLTLGEPRVQGIRVLDGSDESSVLSVAAALESRSSHPLAVAIVREARARGLDTQPAEAVNVLAGRGVNGYVNGRAVWLGSTRHAREMLNTESQPAVFTRDMDRQIELLEQAGNTVVVVGEGPGVSGLLALADAVRPEAREVIAMLHAQGIKEIVMLTGDNPATARAVAHGVGIDTVHAGLLPEDKVAQVEALCARYSVVAMIGDGVNDAPAMARASFGVAMGAIGSDTAIETADVALMGDELERLPWLVDHARRTLRVIRQNIAFSLIVKAVFVILTFSGFATLWGAIAADVGATLLVVGNALRLLRADR